MTVAHESAVAPEMRNIKYSSKKSDKPSTLLATSSDLTELRGVSLKNIIATRYVQLNETLLDVLDVKSQHKIGDELEDEKVTDYEELSKKLEIEVKELEKEVAVTAGALPTNDLDLKIAAALASEGIRRKRLLSYELSTYTSLAPVKSRKFEYKSATDEEKRSIITEIINLKKGKELPKEEDVEMKLEVEQDLSLSMPLEPIVLAPLALELIVLEPIVLEPLALEPLALELNLIPLQSLPQQPPITHLPTNDPEPSVQLPGAGN